MEIKEFKNSMINLAKLNNLEFQEVQLEKLYIYMQLLIEWNSKMNLTAIINEPEIMLKHFIDSAIIKKYIKEKSRIIDVGTGAGFPGVVLRILNEKCQITLLDALNKRITFLNEVIKVNDLKNIELLHERAENIGQNIEYREKYDIVVSRAVANMNVLLEYMLPLVKINGTCICMKSISVNEDVEKSKNVIKALGGELENVEKIVLLDENGQSLERNIVVIRKKCSTDLEYPRNSNKINKKPLF